MRPFRIMLTAVVIALLVGVVPIRAGSPAPWPTKQWASSTPEEQGIDSAQLISVLPRNYSDYHSIVVIRHGYIVLDASAYPFQSSQPHALRDTAGPFTSTLIGIAIDKGYIKGLDQSIWDFLPKEKTANMDARKAAITIKDLLTDSSGLKFPMASDVATYYPLTAKEQSWVQVFLDQEMAVQPGTQFNFLYGDALVLSAILQKATGMTTLDFAKQNLFGPLGITDVTWRANPQGITIGADELYLSPRDIAKLGYLYLHNGQWEGKQIASSTWVKAATTKRFDFPFPGFGGVGCTWLDAQFEPSPYTGYWYPGGGGTAMWVIPALDLVVVSTAGKLSALEEGSQPFAKSILPAVKAEKPLPANPEALAQLNARIQSLANPAPEPVAPVPDNAKAALGRLYTLADNTLGWKSIGVDLGTQEATLTLDAQDRHLKLPVGLDNVFRVSPAGLPANPAIFRLSEEAPLALRGRWMSTKLEVSMLDLTGKEQWVSTLDFSVTNEIRVDVAATGGLPGAATWNIKGVAQ
jgi:CubicO group peptidase (beta-lactamase class C family)